jgi:protein phosphatase
MTMNVGNPLLSLPWQGAGLTDVGRVRNSNQDAFSVENQLGLWVVADGMGGHAGGHIASDLAIQSVVEHVRQAYHMFASGQRQTEDAVSILQAAVAAGDTAIRQKVSTIPELEGMGTTLVIALLCPTPPIQIAIAHVGDSRGYLIHDTEIRPLTRDHSFVQRLLIEGQITPEDAMNHPNQNLLLRALGADDQSKPDINLYRLEPHDIVLLCTDGLTKMISEEYILAIISENRNSPLEACRQLIEAANLQGGKDNTTVVLVSPSH